MASKKYKFSVDEILELKNPVNNYSESVAHEMVRAGHYFSVEELIELGDIASNVGLTISHYMCLIGNYRFSVEELLQLGNPKDKFGESLSQMMEKRGRKFTAREKFILKSGLRDHKKAELAWRIEQGEEITMAEVIQYPDLVERYADRLA